MSIQTGGQSIHKAEPIPLIVQDARDWYKTSDHRLEVMKAWE